MSIARYICVRLGPDSIWAILLKKATIYFLFVMIAYVIVISTVSNEYGRPFGGVEVSTYLKSTFIMIVQKIYPINTNCRFVFLETV